MLRRLALGFLILLLSTRVLAIDALVAHAIFYAPDSTRANKLMPSVETYWQINPHSVHYTTTPEKTIIARIRTDIYFSNETGLIRQDHFILQTVPRTDVNELMAQKIIDLRRHFVTPGFIRMKFVLTDLADSLHKFTYTDSFQVNPAAGKPFYSDLQLLDTVLESPARSAFKKNGHQQVPACMNFVDDNRSILHYYGELYNTSSIPKSDLPAIQKISIAKREQEFPIGNFLRKDTINPKSLNLISGDFQIGSLPSGNYYLNISLENNSHIIIGSASLFFQRLNTHPIVEDTGKKRAAVDTGMENITVLNLQKTFIAKYNIPQTHAILKMLLPVSDPLGAQTINGFLKKPDDLYIRYYIYNYFAGINKKDPAAAWKDYSTRIKEVNKLFSEHGMQGYETERGYTYLRYGKPTDIITVENEVGTLPYEVWQYNVLTQLNHIDIADAVFLFYKPNQVTEGYKMLHSSVAGEVQNPSWRSYLYTNDQGGSNGNSRAEQYIGNK